MSTDDAKKPAPVLPPPTKSGGLRPPKIEPPKIEGESSADAKAVARSVGVDTMFVDGLAEGLSDDPAPNEPEIADSKESKPGASEASEAAASTKEPAENEDEAVEKKKAEPSENAATLFFDPDEKSDDEPGDKLEGKPAVSRSSPAQATPIPRTWLIAGGAVLALILIIAFSGSDDESDTETTASSAVAQRPAGSDEEHGASPQGGAAGEAGAAGAAGEGEAAGQAGAAEDARSGADEGEPSDAAVAGAGATATDGEETDAAAEEEVMEVEIDDEQDDGGDSAESSQGSAGGSPSSLPRSKRDPDRAAEQEMSAEELLAAAKDAYKARRYRDAYRQANLSQNKKASEDALELKAKAACGLNNRDLAKKSFKQLPLGERRRNVRESCRSHDIHMGI